jgi:acylphosphatase
MKELILSGMVQGVFCRHYCSQNARALGISGAATNLTSGSVSVIIDTDDDETVKKYIKALRENPNRFRFMGNITRIDVSDYSGTVSGDYIF